MYKSIIIAAASLLFSSVAIAAPAGSATSAPPSKPTHTTTPWSVTNYLEGCSPGGCTYNFRVKAPARDPFPAFDVRCKGTDVQKDLVPCRPAKNGTVNADLIPQKDGLILRVNQEFSAPIVGGEATYWTDGFHLFKSGRTAPSSFRIFPNQTYAVA